MKRFILTAAVASVLAVSGVARAHDAYDDSESYPLRVVAYVLYPVGWAAEWLVMRPIHFFVSQPKMEPIFGHVPHESPYGDYRPYKHDRAD